MKIKLDEAKDTVKRCKRENDATIAQEKVWKKRAMKAEAESKEAMKKLQTEDNELEVEKKGRNRAEEARKRAEEARNCAEDRASELEVRVSRMTQSVKDVKNHHWTSITQMRPVINRRTADIHPHVIRVDRRKFFLCPRPCVVQFNRGHRVVLLKQRTCITLARA